jgi:hypothetical protein
MPKCQLSSFTLLVWVQCSVDIVAYLLRLSIDKGLIVD